jgi:8-oxo-dGTP pyrophosphatase MutT (NUDIX family)
MKRSQFDPAEGDPRSQVAALCWRKHRDRVEVLLITSRETGRWVLPKGWPIDGHDAPGSAAQEAWEEAGVTGAVNPAVVGLFGYDKVTGPKTSLPCMVSVFGLRVAGLARQFPERKERRRKWFPVDIAARKVAEAELRTLLRNVAKGAVLLEPGGAA